MRDECPRALYKCILPIETDDPDLYRRHTPFCQYLPGSCIDERVVIGMDKVEDALAGEVLRRRCTEEPDRRRIRVGEDVILLQQDRIRGEFDQDAVALFALLQDILRPLPVRVVVHIAPGPDKFSGIVKDTHHVRNDVDQPAIPAAQDQRVMVECPLLLEQVQEIGSIPRIRVERLDVACKRLVKGVKPEDGKEGRVTG